MGLMRLLINLGAFAKLECSFQIMRQKCILMNAHSQSPSSSPSLHLCISGKHSITGILPGKGNVRVSG